MTTREPETEAGRRLLAEVSAEYPLFADDILAIEAEMLARLESADSLDVADEHHPSCCGACDTCLQVCWGYHGPERRKRDRRAAALREDVR